MFKEQPNKKCVTAESLCICKLKHACDLLLLQCSYFFSLLLCCLGPRIGMMCSGQRDSAAFSLSSPSFRLALLTGRMSDPSSQTKRWQYTRLRKWKRMNLQLWRCICAQIYLTKLFSLICFVLLSVGSVSKMKFFLICLSLDKWRKRSGVGAGLQLGGQAGFSRWWEP